MFESYRFVSYINYGTQCYALRTQQTPQRVTALIQYLTQPVERHKNGTALSRAALSPTTTTVILSARKRMWDIWPPTSPPPVTDPDGNLNLNPNRPSRNPNNHNRNPKL